MSKNIILTGGIFFLLGFLLLHPAESLSCARAGMTLWLNTLIPTLLPFIILTGVLTYTGHIRKFLLPFESFFRIFPGVSIWGGYVFVLGMLCGYPLGAKLASDLYESQKISKKEALYLTTFCNNPSPAFIITYLGKSCLKDAVPAGMIFAGILSANLICMLFFRYPVYKNTIISALPPMHKNTSHGTIHIQSIPESPNSAAQISSHENVLDLSIMNGFETITRLGGYILLFSVLAGCIRYYEPFPPFFQYLVLGFTEITTGLSLISSSGLSDTTRIILSIAATASGGLCILAQTRSVLHHDLSILPYFISKCICTFLTAGILYCLISYL